MSQSRWRIAQKNPKPGGCWGCMSKVWGYCDKPARPGMLTCWWHARAEDNARKLMAKLAGEANYSV